MSTAKPPSESRTRHAALGAIVAGGAAIALTAWLVARGSPAREADAAPALGSSVTAASARPAFLAPPRPVAPVGEILRGSVVTGKGAPIAGARVRLYVADPETRIGDEDEPAPIAEVRSGADGTFQARVPKGTVFAETTADGFATDISEADAPGDELKITLVHGAAIVGRVVRADTGEPMAGVEVFSSSDAFGSPDRTRTDAEGRFRIDGLAPARYKPTARARGFFGVAAAGFPLAAKETSGEVTIKMHPATVVTGKITLASTGAACPGGSVRLLGRSYMDAGTEARADEAGDVELESVLPGSYDVEVTCPGHAEGQAVNEPLEVSGDATTASFVVRDELAIRGVVVSESGEPLSTVEVQLRDAQNEETQIQDVSTDAEGRFVMRGMEPGKYRVATYGSFGRLSDFAEVEVSATSDPGEVRLVRRATLKLAGRVVDERGKAVEGASIEVSAESGNASAVADEAGHFELADAPAGAVTLGVYSDQSVPLRVLSGESSPVLPVDHEVKLVVEAPPRGKVSGRVTDAKGPREGVDVTVQCWPPGNREEDEVDAWHFSSSATTDEEGRFTIEGVPRGSCTFDAATDGGESAHLENVPVGGRAELRLRAGGTLRGQIAGLTGVFHVTAESDSDYQAEAFFETNGAWEIRGVHAGTVTVTVQTDDGRTGEAEIQLGSGEARSVSVELHEDTEEGDDAPDGAEGMSSTEGEDGEEGSDQMSQSPAGEGPGASDEPGPPGQLPRKDDDGPDERDPATKEEADTAGADRGGADRAGAAGRKDDDAEADSADRQDLSGDAPPRPAGAGRPWTR